MARQQAGVAVRTGDEQPRFAGVLCGQTEQRGGEHGILRKRRVLHSNADKAAAGQRRQRTAADGKAADTAGFIKAAGHAVDIGIPAQQHRQHPRHTNPPCRKCMRQGGNYVVIV